LRDFDADTSIEALVTCRTISASIENIRLVGLARAPGHRCGKYRRSVLTTTFPTSTSIVTSSLGQTRQMLIAPREIQDDKLPASSRNWIKRAPDLHTRLRRHDRTLRTAFSPEGLPQFVLSDMPVVPESAEIKVTRPEIYFGELTDRYVYVKTKQKEFDYPQGDINTYTTYEGTGGIPIGQSFAAAAAGLDHRRCVKAAVLG
jgi:hypothetical protein